MAELPDDLVQKDLDVTRRALAKLRVIAPEKSYTKRIAEDFLNMAPGPTTRTRRTSPPRGIS